MSQGIWEQRLRELSWASVDVRLTHNQRISTALDALSRELANAIPDDLKGEVRVAADNAMNDVRNKAIALATRLNTVDSTVTNANETRRDLAQRGIAALDNFPSEMSPWQEAIVRGAVTGATIWFGPLSWVAGEGAAWSINNYLAKAREAEAQAQVRKISEAMDRYTFDGAAPGDPRQSDQNDRDDRGGDPGTSSYDMIPGSDYNPINDVINPQGPNGNPQSPNTPEVPYCGPFIGPNPDDPDFDPDNPVSWEPRPWNPELPDCPPRDWDRNDDLGDPNFNWPIGTADPPNWTPDDPTGNGSNTWPRPGGIGGPGVPGGPGGFGGGGGGGYAGGTGGFGNGGGGSALVGGAGGGVALGGAKLMAGARTGAGLAGGGMMGGGMMGGGAAGGAGRGGAGGARGLSAGAAGGAGRGGVGAAGGAAGRGGVGVAGGAAGQGSASKSAGTRGGAGRSGAGMAGAGQNRDSDKKKRGVGLGAGIVAPSLDADEEIGARSQAAEAGGRMASGEFDE